MEPRAPSFRTRVAVSAAGLCGLVLLISCGSLWLLLSRFGMRGVDHDLLARLQPHLAAPHDAVYWGELDQALRFIYRDAADPGGEPLLLLVRSPDGQVRYCSPQWPPELPVDLPRDGRALRPPRRPPPDGFRPPPPMPPPQAPPSLLFDEPPPGPPGPPDSPGSAAGPAEFLTYGGRGPGWRLCTLHGPAGIVTLGVGLGPLHGQMKFARNGFLLLVPLALLVVAAGSWLLAEHALRSVDALAEVAEGVTAANLDQRIPTVGVEAEFQRVIVVLNAMLDRLEASFQQAVRFSADAAHELKTPLAILQGQLEAALREAEPDSSAQRVFGDLLGDVERLKGITRKLLLLSLADAGRLLPAGQRLDLGALVGAAVEDAGLLAPDLTVTTHIQEAVTVAGDADLLGQAVGNVVMNAARHNRLDGAIDVTLSAAEGWAELSVANTGPGIPLDEQSRVFERFYRADPSRSRQSDGIGLGLSLAREIVKAHGGELVLVESGEDRTVFALRLPLMTVEGSDVSPRRPHCADSSGDA